MRGITEGATEKTKHQSASKQINNQSETDAEAVESPEATQKILNSKRVKA